MSGINDEIMHNSGKDHGGGVCFYVNERWCNTVTVRDRICTPDIELLSISLRPFYIPREFSQLFFTLVYVQPRANVSRAAEHMSNNLQKLESLAPDAPKFILGDFNHCDLSKSTKNIHQYVSCPTRFDKILDKCYGTVPDAYKSFALPPLGSSDHNVVMLAPIYTPVIKRIKRVTKTVKNWSADSIASLKAV